MTLKAINKTANPDIVHVLKSLLALAEEGEIYSLAYVTLNSDATFTKHAIISGKSSHLEMIGALKLLSRDLEDELQ